MSPPVPVAPLGTVDYATAVVVLVIAVTVTFAAAAVVWQYAKRLRSGYQGRLLLWHVVVVAASVSGTWLTLAVGQLAILGIWDTPRAARLVGYAMFGVGTTVALLLIGVLVSRAVAAEQDGDQ